MTQPQPYQAPTLAQLMDQVISARQQTRLTPSADDLEDWNEYYPLKKGEWKFTYPTLSPHKSFPSLKFRENTTKVLI
jgi:hypothetical protein